MISSLTDKRIIVAPLFWGLGHATRCIPIIRQLLDQGNHIAIASDGEALALLQQEFPKLDHFKLPSYKISYKYNSMLINMAIQAPHILLTIDEEQEEAEKIVKDWSADVIISDNRLGFQTDSTHNIYITHQLKIPHKNPILAGIASRLHKKYIHDFDECWIPDNEGAKSITGKMTRTDIKIPHSRIGVLSRLQKYECPKLYDYTAILSGPEPQRTMLENEIISTFNNKPKLKLCLVRGSDIHKSDITPNINIKTYNLLQSKELNDIINASEVIICRAGYTSIMDLIKLDKEAILIPTPGQYEQEYLAKTLAGRDQFSVFAQSEIREGRFWLSTS